MEDLTLTYLRGFRDGKDEAANAAATIALRLAGKDGENIAAAILELCSTEAYTEPSETRQGEGQVRSRSDER